MDLRFYIQIIIHLFGHEGETSFFFIDAVRYYSKPTINVNCQFYDADDNVPRPSPPPTTRKHLSTLRNQGGKFTELQAGQNDLDQAEGRIHEQKPYNSAFEKQWIENAVKSKGEGLSKNVLQKNILILSDSDGGSTTTESAFFKQHHKKKKALDILTDLLTVRRTVGIVMMYTLVLLIVYVVCYRQAEKNATFLSGRCCKCRQNITAKPKPKMGTCDCRHYLQADELPQGDAPAPPTDEDGNIILDMGKDPMNPDGLILPDAPAPTCSCESTTSWDTE